MIIAIKPPKELAERLAVVDGGLKPETLHFTLFFLGASDVVSQEKYAEYVAAVTELANTTPPFTIHISGKGKFEKVRMTTDPSGNMVVAETPTDVIFLKGEGTELFSFRNKLADILDERDLYFSKLHKTFSPHLSLKYVPHGEDITLEYDLPLDFTVECIDLWGDGADFKQEIPLKGVK